MNELVEIVPCVYLGSYNSVTENSLEQGNIKFIVNVTKHMPPREVSSHMSVLGCAPFNHHIYEKHAHSS